MLITVICLHLKFCKIMCFITSIYSCYLIYKYLLKQNCFYEILNYKIFNNKFTLIRILSKMSINNNALNLHFFCSSYCFKIIFSYFFNFIILKTKKPLNTYIRVQQILLLN